MKVPYSIVFDSYGGYDCMSSAHHIHGPDINNIIEIMCQCSVMDVKHQAHDECFKGREIAERIVRLLNADSNNN